MAEAQATPGDMHVCAVCLEDMTSRNPRALSCLHTFCEICIEKLAVRDTNITCPTCRKVTTLPDGAVSELPINFMIKAFMETPVCTATGTKCKILCQLCEGLSNQSLSYRCTDCCVSMCGACMKTHLGEKFTADHHIVICEDYDESCKYHNLPSRFWCSSCKEEVCAKCLSSKKHAAHDLSHPSGKPSREKLENTRALILDLAKTKLSLTQAMEMAAADVKQQIIQHSEMLKHQIGKSENELLTKLACILESASTSKETYINVCEQLKDEAFEQTPDVTAAAILCKLKTDVSDEILTTVPNVCLNATDIEVGMFTGNRMKWSTENTGMNKKENIMLTYEKPDRSNGWSIESSDAFCDIKKHFPFPPANECLIEQKRCKRIDAVTELEVTSEIGYIEAGPLAAINGGGAVITDAKRPRIIVINDQGRKCFIARRKVSSGGVQAIALYKEVIFAVIDNKLHRLHLQVIEQEVHVTCLVSDENHETSGLAVLDESHAVLLTKDGLLLLDVGGYITSTVLVQDLKNARDVTISRSLGDVIIYVTWCDEKSSYVNMYDCAGRLLKQLTRGYCYYKTVVSSFGTLLSTYRGNAIVEYDTSGNNVRIFVVQHDNVCIAFQFPHIWTCCKNQSTVRKYKIYATK